MADLPRSDLETDEAPLQPRRVVQPRVPPQLHSAADDKHPCILDDRVDSGVGYSLASQEYSALSIEEVRDFLSSDYGRASYRQHMVLDNRPVSYRSDSISTSLQNQLRNLSIRECDHHNAKDSVRSSRCDSGICDSGICVSSGNCYSGVSEHEQCSGCTGLEVGFPECGLTSAAHFDSTFSHQELQELFSQDEDGDTYLHMSIIHMLPDVSLKVISVAPHADCVSIPNRLQQTPLHLAVATCQHLVVRRLMVAGANLEALDHQGNSALHMACREGQVDMVRMLLSPVSYEETLANQYPLPRQRVPQDLTLRNYEGYTCAHLALQGGHLNVLDLLLAGGANINEADGKSGRTLLHMAADLGYLPALELLLRQQGLQLDARTYGGLTAVTLAHGRQLNQVVDLLHRAGADCSQINSDQESAESSDEEMTEGVYDDICINGQPVQIS